MLHSNVALLNFVFTSKLTTNLYLCASFRVQLDLKFWLKLLKFRRNIPIDFIYNFKIISQISVEIQIGVLNEPKYRQSTGRALS